MNRLKKWIISGLVLIAIGDFVNSRTSQDINADTTMPAEGKAVTDLRSGSGSHFSPMRGGSDAPRN